MGAYISVQRCQRDYNITLDCGLGDFDKDSHKYTHIGQYSRGEFPANPDIAGIGILNVFLGVTCFALAISVIDVGWQLWKTAGWKKTKTAEEKMTSESRRSVSDILQTLVLACSDQQVFTGAAYALTLRYWAGCQVSAYHYNLVANMMLLTCATHLMSVTVVRNYWKFAWLAILRVLCISGVFIVTGVFMANQNAIKQPQFPTTLPAANETDSLMFLPAACFQDDNTSLTKTFEDSTRDSQAFLDNTLMKSTPNNAIQGWNWYVIILLFYGAAIIAEFIRFCRRGRSRPGWRAKVGNAMSRLFKSSPWLRKLFSYLFLIYLAGGVGVSSAAVVKSGQYIFALRAWVDRSGWIHLEDGKNPENDATSFGQLVPIFMSAMILFSFAQTISEKVTDHGNRKHAGEQLPPQTGTITFFDPSHYDITSPEKGNMAYHGANIATPGTIDLDSAHSPWPNNKPAQTSTSTVTLPKGGRLSKASPRTPSSGGFAVSPGQWTDAGGYVADGYTAVPQTYTPTTAYLNTPPSQPGGESFQNTATWSNGTGYSPLVPQPQGTTSPPAHARTASGGSTASSTTNIGRRPVAGQH